MAAKDRGDATSPAVSPSKITARVRTLHGDVRFRAGLHIAARGWTDLEVTPEQLRELEADRMLEVTYTGKPARDVAWEPDSVSKEDHLKAVANVRGKLQELEARHAAALAEIRDNHTRAAAKMEGEHRAAMRAALLDAIETARKDKEAKPQTIADAMVEKHARKT
jgi:hypothetical protein